jgi:spore germination protein GerM
VIPIRFGAATTTVSVFYTDDAGELVEVTRTVPETLGVLKASLEQLLLGPQDVPAEAGLSSSFGSQTAGLAFTVTIEGGVAIVDFDASLPTLMNNASTSAGSAQLIAQLNATVFQFENVTGAEYRLGGSCDAFWQWLQGECHEEARP